MGFLKPGWYSWFITTVRIVLAVALLFTLYAATERHPVGIFPQNSSDKVLHAFAFFCLSLLMDMAYPASRHLLAKVIFLVIFGIFIELVQVYLPWRSAEVMDFVADCFGMALYLVPVLAVRRMLKRRARQTF